MTETAVEIYNNVAASLAADAAPFGLREVDALGDYQRTEVDEFPARVPAGLLV